MRTSLLIADLAKLEDWQGGLSPSTGGGVGFAPAFEGMYRVDRTKPANHAYRALVAAGPDAIPFLLAHLDDRTTTSTPGATRSTYRPTPLRSGTRAFRSSARSRTAVTRRCDTSRRPSRS